MGGPEGVEEPPAPEGRAVAAAGVVDAAGVATPLAEGVRCGANAAAAAAPAAAEDQSREECRPWDCEA